MTTCRTTPQSAGWQREPSEYWLRVRASRHWWLTLPTVNIWNSNCRSDRKWQCPHSTGNNASLYGKFTTMIGSKVCQGGSRKWDCVCPPPAWGVITCWLTLLDEFHFYFFSHFHQHVLKLLSVFLDDNGKQTRKEGDALPPLIRSLTVSHDITRSD